MSIKFYTNLGPPELGNYYVHDDPLVIDGQTYASSEHYYQSQKFIYPGTSDEAIEYAELVREARTPNIARELASQRIGGQWAWRKKLNPIIAAYKPYVKLNPDWETYKLKVMKKALIEKFTQDAHCKKVLLGTKNKTLIEHTHRDRYWADGGNGNGKNMLGILLMEVRDELTK